MSVKAACQLLRQRQPALRWRFAKSRNLIRRIISNFFFHPTAGMTGEADSALPRTRAEGHPQERPQASSPGSKTFETEPLMAAGAHCLHGGGWRKSQCELEDVRKGRRSLALPIFATRSAKQFMLLMQPFN